MCRWVPSALQLADSLTKPGGDPADTLRSVLRSGKYQLRSEHEALESRAAEKARGQALGAQMQESTLHAVKRRKVDKDQSQEVT